MTEQMKDEFINYKSLDSLSWVSNQTRRNAMEKVCHSSG